MLFWTFLQKSNFVALCDKLPTGIPLLCEDLDFRLFQVLSIIPKSRGHGNFKTLINQHFSSPSVDMTFWQVTPLRLSPFLSLVAPQRGRPQPVKLVSSFVTVKYFTKKDKGKMHSLHSPLSLIVRILLPTRRRQFLPSRSVIVVTLMSPPHALWKSRSFPPQSHLLAL